MFVKIMPAIQMRRLIPLRAYPCAPTSYNLNSSMSFHQLEADRVLQDAQDTQRLVKILEEFGELRGRYACAEKEIAALTAEVNKLRELNRALEDGKKREEVEQEWQSLSAKEAHLLPFSQTHNSYFQVQQTKRKVINGFVAELTSELDSSENLLLKERRMLEDLRRSLQASHEEVLTLKTANRALEADMGAVLSENRQLLRELSELQARKDALEEGWVEAGCRRSALGRRAQAEEEEFLLMDQIYRQIEAELEGQ